MVIWIDVHVGFDSVQNRDSTWNEHIKHPSSRHGTGMETLQIMRAAQQSRVAKHSNAIAFLLIFRKVSYGDFMDILN